MQFKQYSVIKLPWILLMQTVWTFLVYFWLLGGLRTPPDPPLRTGMEANEKFSNMANLIAYIYYVVMV